MLFFGNQNNNRIDERIDLADLGKLKHFQSEKCLLYRNNLHQIIFRSKVILYNFKRIKMTNNLFKIKAVKSKYKCNPSTITTWSDGKPISFSWNVSLYL